METDLYLYAEFTKILASSAHVLWVNSDTADFQVTLKYKFTTYSGKF